ncbi:MAG: hypothetical protein IJ896_02950 [Fibrobacter sp.]|nr:hypothetical protein [Fibrobacter sp.]
MNYLMQYIAFLLGAFALFAFSACSEYPEMENDILAYHVFNEGQLDVANDDSSYVDLVARSFGISPKEVRKVQKYIVKKGTETNLRFAYEAMLHAKVVELLDRTGNGARKDYVVNVLAPYLNSLTKNEPYKSGIDREIFENDLICLFGKFFGSPHVLRDFVDDLHRYNNGGVSSTDNLNALNKVLVEYNLFVVLNQRSNLNVLKVDDVILPPSEYKWKSISVLNLKRIMPGLLPPLQGFYTAGENQVVVIDDMVKTNVEEIAAEIEQGKFFSKYEDRRFDKFWHSIGLNLNVEKASKIYKTLMKKDFAGHTKTYIKTALSMEIAIHEAKHLVDQIEHPELTLNLDAEFSAHVTSAIFNPAPRAALLSAIRRMENYAMYHRLSRMNEVARKLWEMAMRSAGEEIYTEDSLRRDLIHLYNDYRTIRENVFFEPLGDFNEKIVRKIAEHYGFANPGDSIDLSSPNESMVKAPSKLFAPLQIPSQQITNRYMPEIQVKGDADSNRNSKKFDNAYYGGVKSIESGNSPGIVIRESDSKKIVVQDAPISY